MRYMGYEGTDVSANWEGERTLIDGQYHIVSGMAAAYESERRRLAGEPNPPNALRTAIREAHESNLAQKRTSKRPS